MKSATQKLSKADRDTSVRDLRQTGLMAADVVGRAAAQAGLIDRPRAVQIDEVPALVTGLVPAAD